MADVYLAYPDSLIQHNGLPVTFLTGSNIGAYGDWDLIIERYRCNNTAKALEPYPNGGSYSGVTFNTSYPPIKTMGATRIANHSILIGNSANAMQSKIVSGYQAGINTVYGLPCEADGQYIGYYFNAFFEDHNDIPYFYGIKWANGIPASPDLTNHGDKKGYSIIHKFNCPTATSLALAFNASNFTEIHNVYAPKLTDTTFGELDCDDGYYSNHCLKVLDNIYIPNCSIKNSGSNIETVDGLTANAIYLSGNNSTITNFSAALSIWLTGFNASVDTLSARDLKLWNGSIRSDNPITAATAYLSNEDANDAVIYCTSALVEKSNFNGSAKNISAISGIDIHGTFTSAKLSGGSASNVTATNLTASGTRLSDVRASSAMMYNCTCSNVSATSAAIKSGNVTMSATRGYNNGTGLFYVDSSYYTSGTGPYVLNFNATSSTLLSNPLPKFSASGSSLTEILISNLNGTYPSLSSKNFAFSGTFDFRKSVVKTGQTSLYYIYRNKHTTTSSVTVDMSKINFIDDPTKTSVKLSIGNTYETLKLPLSAKSWLSGKFAYLDTKTLQWV